MAKFIKKLSIVDAVQYFPGVAFKTVFSSNGTPYILEWDGPREIYPTDWLVTYSDGKQELHCDGAFKNLYEPVY